MAAALLGVAFKVAMKYFAEGYQEQMAWRQAVKYKLKYGNQGKVDVAYTGATTPRRRLYGYFRASGLDVLPAISTSAPRSRLATIASLYDASPR